MKAAQQWIDQCRDASDRKIPLEAGDVLQIQLDAKQDAADHIIGHLRMYWGHEIVRTLARQIAAAYTLPEPREPFHPERLHPGANRPEVHPKAAEVPLQGKVVPAPKSKERVWANCCEEDSLGSLPPSAHPNPKTSNPPPSPAPCPPHPAEECPPCADPPVPDAAAWEGTLPPEPALPNAHELAPWALWKRLVSLQEQVDGIKRLFATEHQLRQVELSTHSQLRHLEATELATASELRERLEELEKQTARLLQENAKRAEHLAKLGDYLLAVVKQLPE